MQNNPRISSKEIDALYTQLMNKANVQMGSLKEKIDKQKKAEEQQRLRRIQEEMEAEKRRKAEEEAQKRQEEENRRK